MVAPGKALVGWQQAEVRGYDFTNSWEDFAAGMAVEQPAIDLLHQALLRPKLDFNLNYQLGIPAGLHGRIQQADGGRSSRPAAAGSGTRSNPRPRACPQRRGGNFPGGRTPDRTPSCGDHRTSNAQGLGQFHQRHAGRTISAGDQGPFGHGPSQHPRHSLALRSFRAGRGPAVGRAPGNPLHPNTEAGSMSPKSN